MNTFNIPLNDVLILLAENLLPARSEQNKILMVVIKMTKKNLIPVYLKIAFWHPNNYMVVSHCYKTDLDWPEDNSFNITANHSSTWKYDGFGYIKKVMDNPDKIDILWFRVAEVEKIKVDEVGKQLLFKLKITVR